MRESKTSFLILAGLVAACLARDIFAQPVVTDRLTVCDNEQSTMEIGGCASREMNRADGALNAVYRELVAALPDASSRQALLLAQRAWLEWRAKEAEFLAQVGDGFDKTGTGFAPAYGLRYAQLTDARSAQLTLRLDQLRQTARSQGR